MQIKDLNPKEAAARLPFKLLGIGLLALMAVVFLMNAQAFFTTSEPVSLACDLRRASVACQLGRLLLSPLAPAQYGKVLGLLTAAVSAFCFWLMWVLWKGLRQR